jgi:hypothetical protein
MFKEILIKLVKNILFKDSNILTRDALSRFKTSFQYQEREIISIKGENHTIIGTEKIPSWKRDFSNEYRFGAPFYTVLDSVICVGGFGTLVYGKNIVLESVLSSKGYLFRNTEWKGVLKARLSKTNKQIEWAFSLANCLSNSYFHFVAETLPNLEVLLAFEKKNPQINPKILLSQNSPKFVYQYLDLFGYHRDRIVELNQENLLVQKMIVASNRFYTLKNPHDDWNRHLYSKSAFEFLSKKLVQNVDSLPFRKIYITRKDAPTRNILNEKDLTELLIKNGFEIFCLSDFSVKEQIQIFSETKTLICPHGAGMVNTIFSKNMKIIELYPKNRPFGYNYHFYQTSNFGNHSHTMLMCDCDETENVHVNLDEILNLLR